MRVATSILERFPTATGHGGGGVKGLSYEDLAAQLVVAVRGRRSQAALSRRGGYRSNVVHRWERGLAWPTAAAFLELCEAVGLDVASSQERFLYAVPAWSGRFAPTSPEAVAALLSQLRGKTPLVDLARRSGVNRYTLSRWMKATSQPKLPEFLMLVELTSRRVIDWLATLVDPAALPAVARRWRRLNAARDAAYEEPWSHAVLRALELRAYKRGRGGSRALIARKLGISVERVEAALSVLCRSGQVQLRGGRYFSTGAARVDTRSDPDRARALRGVWMDEAVQRCRDGHPGAYGFSLFSVSKPDMQRLRELHLEYVRAMQQVIASSSESGCVGLYCAQLLDLDAGPANALLESVKST